jgi:hypothetical protein
VRQFDKAGSDLHQVRFKAGLREPSYRDVWVTRPATRGGRGVIDPNALREALKCSGASTIRPRSTGRGRTSATIPSAYSNIRSKGAAEPPRPSGAFRQVQAADSTQIVPHRPSGGARVHQKYLRTRRRPATSDLSLLGPAPRPSDSRREIGPCERRCREPGRSRWPDKKGYRRGNRYVRRLDGGQGWC